MRLNSDNTIITSSDSKLRLSVFSSNYYLRDTDVAVFTVNGTAYPCAITQRVYINVDFDVSLVLTSLGVQNSRKVKINGFFP